MVVRGWPRHVWLRGELSFSAGSSPGMQDREGSFRGALGPFQNEKLRHTQVRATREKPLLPNAHSSPVSTYFQGDAYMHTDRFTPLDAATLLRWMQHDLPNKQLFGIDRELFFMPKPDDPFRMERYGKVLETPLGVAAGPHTQLARTSCPRGCAALGISNSRPCRCSTS